MNCAAFKTVYFVTLSRWAFLQHNKIFVISFLVQNALLSGFPTSGYGFQGDSWTAAMKCIVAEAFRYRFYPFRPSWDVASYI